MTGRLAVTFLLLAVPAFGQSRVYTNADLGKIERTRTVTEEELASLRAHQFVYVPPLPRGPEVVHVNSSTAEGPFGPFHMPQREPLGSPLRMDGGWGGWGRGVRGPVTVAVPNLSVPGPIAVPDFARGPISIGPPAPTSGRRRRASRD